MQLAKSDWKQYCDDIIPSKGRMNNESLTHIRHIEMVHGVKNHVKRNNHRRHISSSALTSADVDSTNKMNPFTLSFRSSRHNASLITTILLFWNLYSTQRAEASVVPAVPTTSHKFSLLPWVQSRTRPTMGLEQWTSDGTEKSLWLYQGTLMDPLTGKVLANVEGVEVLSLKGIWQNETSSTSSASGGITSSFLARLPQNNPLTNWTRSLLTIDNNKLDMQAAAVWTSRKVFLYRSTDDNALLSTVRLKPASPTRKVPLSQAISIWDSTTSVWEPSGTSSWLFGTAFTSSSPAQPKRTTLVWNTAPLAWEEDASEQSTASIKSRKKKGRRGKKQQQSKETTGSLEFTIHARPRQGDQVTALQNHFAQLHRPSGLAPPRTALVSLGTVGTVNGGNTATAHETYRYNLPSGRLSYSRYGEGPVWYGPHRTCRLELRGQCQTNLQQLSPVLQELVRRLVTASDLSVAELFPEEMQARQATQPVWRKRFEWVRPYWQRVVKASSIEALPDRPL